MTLDEIKSLNFKQIRIFLEEHNKTLQQKKKEIESSIRAKRKAGIQYIYDVTTILE